MGVCRFGLMGPGRIADKFAGAFSGGFVANARLVAVASATSLERARAFGERHSVARAYGSYRELLEDEGVDAVYIATPNHLHRECCLLCFRAGKHVLCEKPLAPTGAEARLLRREAAQAGVFFMEAMWSRFLPTLQAAREWVDTGQIGRLRNVSATLCNYRSPEEYRRLYDPALQGGALRDLGGYGIQLIQYLAGGSPLDQAHVLLDPAPTGVDASAYLHLSYRNGLVGEAKCSIAYSACNCAYLYGEAGCIRLAADFHFGPLAELFSCAADMAAGTPVQARRLPPRHAFSYEIAHAADCINRRLGQSPVMPLSDSVEIADIFDKALRESGLEESRIQ